MIASLQRFANWLAYKLAVAVLVAVLAFAACAFWLFIHDNVDFDTALEHEIARLKTERQQAVAALAADMQHITAVRLELAKQQMREQQADKAIAGLHGLESWWERVFGDSGQQRVYAEQRERMGKLKHDAEVQEVQLQEELVRSHWEKDGLEIEITGIDKRLHEAEGNPSRIVHYLALAWFDTRWIVAGVLGLCFFGPALGKLALFFAYAPLISRGDPVRLAGELAAPPLAGESQASLELSLWPGERLWAKEAYLQEKDKTLGASTRLMLDWRRPLTCLVCGLFDLVQLRNIQAGRECVVTFSRRDDPTVELVLVSVPDGGSFVLRPVFLKAVVLGHETRPKISRRWLFTWQSWVSGQFRHFEFAGPCRLLVAARGGVRVERLIEREGQVQPVRRAVRGEVMGFAPNLACKPVRTGKFWPYFRGKTPLFDLQFAGSGVFLCQQKSARGHEAGPRKFYARVWNGTLKIFGV